MRRRLISVLLTVAIVVGCMTGLPLYADGPDYAAINIAAGEKKTITVTSSEDWVYYSFTPDSDGKYGILISDSFNVDVRINNRYVETNDVISYASKDCHWFRFSQGTEVTIVVSSCEDEQTSGTISILRGTADISRCHMAVNGENMPLDEYWYDADYGQTYTLKAVCDCDPSNAAVNYQWYKRTGTVMNVPCYLDEFYFEDLTDFTVVSGATTNSLTISNLTQSADYLCRISVGSSGYEYKYVYQALYIETFEVSDDYFGGYEGEDLECKIDYGGSATLTFHTAPVVTPAVTLDYAWYRVNFDETETKVSSGSVKAGKDISLTVNNVKSHSYYICRISDAYGNKYEGTALVYFDNQFDMPSSANHFVVTDQAKKYTLSAPLENPDPDYHYVWRKWDPDTERFVIIDGSEGLTTITTDYISLSTLETNSNHVLYTCEVWTEWYHAWYFEDTVEFFFYSSDDFAAYPHDEAYYHEVPFGGSVELQVDVTGGTNVTYEWNSSNGTFAGNTNKITVDYEAARESEYYHCYVQSDQGYDNIYFYVDPVPTFECENAGNYSGCFEVYGVEGETVTLSVADKIIPGAGFDASNLTYTWYRYDGSYGDVMISNANGATYKTGPLIYEVQEYFYCIISDGYTEQDVCFEIIYDDSVYGYDEDDFSVNVDVRSDNYGEPNTPFEIRAEVYGCDTSYWTVKIYDEDENLVWQDRNYGLSVSSHRFEEGVPETTSFEVVVTNEDGISYYETVTILETWDGHFIDFDVDDKTHIETFGNRYSNYGFEGDEYFFTVEVGDPEYKISSITATSSSGDTTYGVNYWGQDKWGHYKYSIIIPDRNVTIRIRTDEYEESDPRPVNVLWSPNGITTISAFSAVPGSKVTVRTTPDSGYVLNKIIVLDSNGSLIYVDPNGRFTMPASPVTVKALYAEEGSVVLTGWVKDDGKWYYYDSNGVKLDGWQRIDGVYYYLDPGDGGAAAIGWLNIDGKYYFFNAAGAMQKGWLSRGKNWYYLDGSGAMVTSWRKIDGKWYFFDRTTGVMATGGWKKIDDVWYYFTDSGNIAVGWEKIEGKWYYFDSNGVMQTGWVKDNGKWYYMNEQGDMRVSRWLNDGGKWYYFGSNGAMVAGTSVVIDDITYRFAANGACENPNGDPSDGWVKVNGSYKYYENGVAVTGWKRIDGKWYSFDEDGLMRKGWYEEGRYTYYLDASGAMVANRTVTIDGTQYAFDASGHLK